MKALPSSVPPARRELAGAVRAMLRATGGSLRGVAGQIHSSRSVLNRLALGKVLFPDTDTVLKLHRLAKSKGGVEVMTEDDLRALLQRVSDECESAFATDNISAAVNRPAAEDVDEMRGALEGGTVAPFDAPVPLAEGDRGRERAPRPAGAGGEKVGDQVTGRKEHARGKV
ncbi:hypothetical protein ACFVHV_08665, partial [Kitasatospora sp. NPDC127116]